MSREQRARKGNSGLRCDRWRGTTDEPVGAESVEDLADQITRAEALRHDDPS